MISPEGGGDGRSFHAGGKEVQFLTGARLEEIRLNPYVVLTASAARP